MKKMFSLTASLIFTLFVLWSCGGGGGGGAAAPGANSDTLAGGCATYEGSVFTGLCQDYYGISASTYKSGCESDTSSVFYADGCPSAIGGSTRFGSCKHETGMEGVYHVVISYSPEQTSEASQSTCTFAEGTWAD